MSHELYTEGQYLESNPSWHVADSPWKAKQILKMIQRNNLTPASVCEVGCGAGEILAQLASAMPKNVQFTGYEISPQAYKICEKRTDERLHFYLKNFHEENTPNYDLLLVIDVIEHVEDYFSFLRNQRTKGKNHIFHIPLDLSVQSVLRSTPIMGQRKRVGHIHYFTKETALASLKDTGYEIIDYFYTHSSIDLKGHTWPACLMKWPRKILFSIHQDFAVRMLGGYSLLVLAR